MANLASQLTPEAVQNNLQSLLQNADALLDQFQALHLSITALLVGAFLCVLILVIATREAVSWFSKVDSVRRDLKRLQKSTDEIDVEVKAIRELLVQLKSPLNKKIDLASSGGSNGSLENQSDAQNERQTSPASGASNTTSNGSSQTDSIEREISRKKVFGSSQSAELLESKQFPIHH